MDLDEVFIVSAILMEEEEREIRQRKKRIWVHDINLKRQHFGEFHTLFPDLLKDEKRFFQYFHMTSPKFLRLLEILKPHITKQSTRLRMAIGPIERLVVCLRYLATGNSFTSLSYNFRMGESTIREIIYSTCEAIWTFMQPIVMPTPDENLWVLSEEGFREKWNFPNVVAAIDGKHILIEAPPHSGSNYFCYKKHFSTVLLVLVDGDKKFIAIDVGAFGKNSDASIFRNSNIGKSLVNGNLNMPPSRHLPGGNTLLPHVIIGDEAFPLSTFLMKPYSRDDLIDDIEKKIFNYRLSRARNTVENSFGLLVRKFRLFERRLHMYLNHTVTVVSAICCLHNFLIDDECEEYWTRRDQSVRLRDMQGLRNIPGTRENAITDAIAIRNAFKDYFNSESGSVHWQLQRAQAGRRQVRAQ